MSTLPPIATLPSLSTSSRAQILDSLFEPCPQLHTLSVSLLQETNFASYPALISGVGSQLTALFESPSTSDTAWLDAILSAHPRLGEKRVENLSEASRAEQAKLQGGAVEEGEKLKALNEEYERTFPGLRYVYAPHLHSVPYFPPSHPPPLQLLMPITHSVFVNGRSRPVIMEDMQRRITTSHLQQEKLDAIRAMCDIANDRAKKLGVTLGVTV